MALIFSPGYEKEGIQKVLSIINGRVRNYYDLIQLTVPPSLHFPFPCDSTTSEWKEYKSLKKNYDSYEHYLKSIPPHLQAVLQREKESFHSQRPSYEVVKAQRFHQLFAKNEQRQKTLQRMENHLFLACYKNITAQYMAIYYEDKLLTFGAYLPGVKEQAFGDIIFNLDREMNSQFHNLALQELIQIFYSENQKEEFHFFNTLNCPQSLQESLPHLHFAPNYGKTYIISSREKRISSSPKSRESKTSL